MNKIAQFRRSMSTWMACLIIAGLFVIGTGRVAADDHWFEINAPHERFCIVRSQNLLPGMEDMFDIGCMVDHHARNPNWNATKSWDIVSVLDIQARKYPNAPENPTFNERIEFLKEQISGIVSAYPPGLIYVIGNETDRPAIVSSSGQQVSLQDDMLPADYAVLYHEIYEDIKATDPTAAVVPAGIVQPTELRLQYLDQMVEAYQSLYGEPMPVDAWHVHNMILNESHDGWGAGIPPGVDALAGLDIDFDENDDMTIFKDQIINFRQWMADHGYRDTPLVVYEYGILLPREYGYPDSRVNAFMTATFDFLLNATDDEIGYEADDNHLVQQWAWYSLNDKPFDGVSGFNGEWFVHTADGGYEITSTGEAFKEYIRPDMAILTGTTLSHTGNELAITIEVANLGIEPVRNGEIEVSIEGGDGANQQQYVPVTDLLGGENNTQTITVTFTNVISGEQAITIIASPEILSDSVLSDSADPTPTIAELSTENNVYTFSTQPTAVTLSTSSMSYISMQLLLIMSLFALLGVTTERMNNR